MKRKTVQEIVAIGFEKYPVERDKSADNAERNAYIFGYLAGQGYKFNLEGVLKEIDKYLKNKQEGK